MGVLDDLGMSRDDLRACIADVHARRRRGETADDGYIDFETIMREGLTLDEREHDPVLVRPRTTGEAASIASFQRCAGLKPDATIRRTTALALLGAPTPKVNPAPSLPLRAETDPRGPRSGRPNATTAPAVAPIRRHTRRRHSSEDLRAALGLPTTKE